jgi:metal-sulfur cluster biosynthetic enzyme
MEVTELGIVTEVRLLQLEKAKPSIEITELGIVTEVRLLQP